MSVDAISMIVVLIALVLLIGIPQVRKLLDPHHRIPTIPEQAVSYVQRQLETEKVARDPDLQSWYLSRLGYSYYQLDDHERAIEGYQQALELLEQHDGTFPRRQQALGSLIGIYIAKDDTDNVIHFYEKLINLAQRTRHWDVLIESLQGVARHYANADRHDDALAVAERVIGISQELEDDEYQMFGLWTAALIYYEQDSYEKALDYGTHALELAVSVDDVEYEFRLINLLIELYNKAENFTLWEQMIKRGMDLAEQRADDAQIIRYMITKLQHYVDVKTRHLPIVEEITKNAIMLALETNQLQHIDQLFTIDNFVHTQRNEFDLASEKLQQRLIWARSHQSTETELMLLLLQANNALQNWENDRGLELAQALKERAIKHKQHLFQAKAAKVQIYVALRRGRLNDYREKLQEGLEIATAAELATEVLLLKEYSALLHMITGEYHKAAQHFQEIIDADDDPAVASTKASARVNQVYLSLAQRDFEGAVELAQEVSQELSDKVELIFSHTLRTVHAEALYYLDRPEEAYQLLGDDSEIEGLVALRGLRAELVSMRGRIQVKRGMVQAGLDSCHIALDLRSQFENLTSNLAILTNVGDAYKQCDMLDKGQAYLQEAHIIAESLSCPHALYEIDQLLGES